MTKQKSFTLIELLVVIVIIGILAGVIMISTSSSIDKANIAKSKVFEESIQNNLAANMVSRWRLDEIINTNKTPDQWGSNTGTLYGANGLPQLRPASECVTDGCFKFDGTDDHVDCGNNTSLDITKDITISVWIKPSSITDYKMIASKSGGSFTTTQWELRTYNNRAEFIASNEEAIYSSYKTGLLVNNWQYIAGVINKNKISIYLNGIKGVDATLLGTKSTTTYSTKIGSRKNASEAIYIFNGYMDDIKIYDTALSITQIKQSYIAGLNSMLSNGNISKHEYNERIEKLGSR